MDYNNISIIMSCDDITGRGCKWCEISEGQCWFAEHEDIWVCKEPQAIKEAIEAVSKES